MVFHKQTYAELLRTAAYVVGSDITTSVGYDRFFTEMQYNLTNAYNNAERMDILKNAYESTTDADLSIDERTAAWEIVNIIEDRIGVDI